MFGINLLSRLASSRKAGVVDELPRQFWEPPAAKPATVKPEPCCVEVQPVRLTLVEPSPAERPQPSDLVPEAQILRVPRTGTMGELRDALKAGGFGKAGGPRYIAPEGLVVRKLRRASGPRMEGGRNKAVLRALAAGCRHLHNGESLKAAARSCNACVPYTRAVVHLRRTDQTALLDAALNGDVPLLVAAYQTATATTITVIDPN